jgi:hypothetical protein
MSLQTKYLDKIKKEQILADFFTDHYDETDFGFLLEFNDDFLLIEKIDSQSNYDGLTIFLRQSITRIRWTGNEIESVAKLIDVSKRPKIEKVIDLTSIHSILKSLDNIYHHVTIYIQDLDKDVCFIGQIHEIDEYSIVIHEFGTKLSLDRRFTLLSNNDITRIDVNGQYENNILKVFDKL